MRTRTVLTALVVLASLAAAAPLLAEDREDCEQRLQRAWHVLEVSGKPEAAARLFREIWEMEDAPREIRGEALLGLARCERMLGNESSASRLIESLRLRFGDVPRVARKLPALAAGGKADGPTRFVTGIVPLPDVRYLDLDSGGVFSVARPTPALEAEIARKGNALEFRAEVSPDPAFARMVRWQSDEPWIRLVTSEGRAAWFQQLRTGGDTVVRFVTRLSGNREPLPAPRAFAVGDGRRIRVQIEPDPRYARYRIERSSVLETEFEELAETAEPFYVDGSPPGKRALYRVTGVTGDGDSGIPVTVHGAVEQKGTFSGNIVFGSWSGPVAVDLFTGVIDEDSRDLVLTGTFGGASAASFGDWLGGRVLPEPDGGEGEPSPWAGKGSWQITPETPFRVPLPGGGVARCRWTRIGRSQILLEYEVNPDAARFGRRLALTAERTPGGVRIRIEKAEDVTVSRIEVESLLGEERTRAIEVDGDQALDTAAREGMLLRYRAVGKDALGRRTGAGEVVVNLMPPGPIVGEFSFHYRQAYSIERQKLVPADEADVVFESCAGGISSVELAAPRGIASLARLSRNKPGLKSRDVILMALRGAVPSEVSFRDEARGDSRDAWSDVFVIRTRNGGWAALAIIGRGKHGGWQEKPVKVRYVYNPLEPVFGDISTTIRDRGFLIDPSKLIEPDVYSPEEEEKNVRQKDVRELLRELDMMAEEKRKSLEERLGRKVNVAAVVSRDRAKALGRGAYVASTYSFEHATRDDETKTRNRWDFVYGNGPGNNEIFAKIMGRTGIWDLGKVDFDAVPETGKEYPDLSSVEVANGRLYVVHTLNSESDYWTKLMVLESKRFEWILFRWEIVRDPSAYRPLERKPDRILEEPKVLLQVRGGAGGGNPNRAFMDGTKNVYVDRLDPARISFKGKPDISEDIRAHIEGGYVPDGQVFIVHSVRYRARADGDSNGHGEFLLRIGPYRVAHLHEDRRSDGCLLSRIGEEDAQIDTGSFPVAGTLFCRVQIRPGDEKHVFAEIANSSYAEVLLEGEFVKEDRIVRDPDLPSNPAVAWFAAMLDHPVAAARAEAKQKLVAIGRDALPYLEELAAHPTSARHRTALDEVMRQIRPK